MNTPSGKPNGKVLVDASPEFQKDIRTLKKRYRNVRMDIQPTIEQIQSGQLPGDQVSGTGFVIYKVRVRNQDIQKGKSAGYRIIYQVESQDSVALLRIYSKSDVDDVSTQAILEIIDSLGKSGMTEQDTDSHPSND